MATIVYRILTEEYFIEARNNVIETFFEGEPTNVAMKVSKEEIATTFVHLLRSCLDSGLSVVALDLAKDVDQVVGVSFNTNEIFQYPEDIPEIYKPIRAIEMELFKGINNGTKGKVAYTGPLVVKKGYTRRGIATSLIAKSLEVFRSHGFEYAVSEFTSYYSFKAGLKNGFEIVSSVSYKDFVYNDYKPFLSVADEHYAVKFCEVKLN